MKVALVGAGRVGTAVAALLQISGNEIIGVASRTTDSALRASERLGCSTYGIEGLPPAELVLIGATDGAIEDVADVIAPRVRRGAFVCHFAGSFGPSVLGSVIDRGASGCALHPVQACPSVEGAMARLPRSAWGVTCSDPGAEDRMIELIDRDLEGFPVVLPEDLRPAWHAAAVMTSNGIAALLGTGEGLLAEIGVADPTRILGPLASGTIDNARDGDGGAATLTGPVVRGENETVERHLRALARLPGLHRDRYLEIARLIVGVAVSSGRLHETDAAAIVDGLET